MGHPPSAWLWEGGVWVAECFVLRRRSLRSCEALGVPSRYGRRSSSGGAEFYKAPGAFGWSPDFCPADSLRRRGTCSGNAGVAVEVEAVADAGSFPGRLRRGVLRCGLGGVGIVCTAKGDELSGPLGPISDEALRHRLRIYPRPRVRTWSTRTRFDSSWDLGYPLAF